MWLSCKDRMGGACIDVPAVVVAGAGAGVATGMGAAVPQPVPGGYGDG